MDTAAKAPPYPYRPPHGWQQRERPVRAPLVIVGAGPVGLVAAIDARLRGLPVVVLDADAAPAEGSRAVCYAKRTLEIFDRLGVGQAVCDAGVSWNVGRTFLREQEVYRFDLVAEPGHQRPGMCNLQQDQLEALLVARALALGADIRWAYTVQAVQPHAEHVSLRVDTPDGPFEMEADWLVVADGARSPIRKQLGLDMAGRVFKDRFLIADVRMQADYPAERWFWFDPPFHPGRSVLLHKQSGHLWRVDFQLGWEADPQEASRPENVLPRLQAMLGDARPFELEWVSVYTFQCRRMAQFRHGRLLFAGDAAHQVSPFGARGANSGVQDADDLMWKLAAVMQGRAGQALLHTYAQDRQWAADENILNSTRSTDFITPKSAVSTLFRDQTLALAQQHPFARQLVNSGRLSVPSFLTASALNTPDAVADPAHAFAGRMVPGAPLDDAPLWRAGQPTWLLAQLNALAPGFACLCWADAPTDPSAAPSWVRWQAPAQALAPLGVVLVLLQRPPSEGSAAQEATAATAAAATASATEVAPNLHLLHDAQGVAGQRCDARAGTVYLLRPDRHVAARWRAFDLQRVDQALARALCAASPTAAQAAHIQTPETSPMNPISPISPAPLGGSAAAAPFAESIAAPQGQQVAQVAQVAQANAQLLTTAPHFHEAGRTFFRAHAPADTFYAALIDAHEGQSAAQSEALNARLILLLANHIGDLGVLRQALQAAKDSDPTPRSPEPHPPT